jgi:site-specific DNA-cytosine methylase
MGKVLVACEESQAVCKAFRKLGHEAFSCDIQPCSGGHSEWHYQQDVFEVIDMGWDMMIAFPPCTHLAVSGARHFAAKIADGRQQAALDFVKTLMNANISMIAIENPVSVISSKIRKADQVIQPWQFGHEAQKTTCLWLKNLPKLKPTQIVGKGDFYVSPSGKKMPSWLSDTNYENGKKIPWDSDDLKKIRSKTFEGIADAMANQWGKLI